MGYQAFPLLSCPRFAVFRLRIGVRRLPQRATLHLKSFLPLVLIVMMSWAVFWIDPNTSNSQISIAVTSMLTLIAYRFAVDGQLPRLPYMTRLDTFFLAS